MPRRRPGTRPWPRPCPRPRPRPWRACPRPRRAARPGGSPAGAPASSGACRPSRCTWTARGWLACLQISPIPSRKQLAFRPSKDLKETVEMCRETPIGVQRRVLGQCVPRPRNPTDEGAWVLPQPLPPSRTCSGSARARRRPSRGRARPCRAP